MQSSKKKGYTGTMESVFEILEQLESDNSRNFKEDVLRRHRDNDLLRRTFVATGDPYVNYYVNKFKMPLATNKPDDDDAVLEEFLSFIANELSTRKVTGNTAKTLTVATFSAMTECQQKWCLRILLRNLRVGVLETTVNKIWPGSISKFSVALAETLPSTHDPVKGIVITEPVKYPVRVEPKLDGLRCIAVKKNGEVTMFTRSGSPIETLPTIKAVLEVADYDDFVLDGEAMGSDWNESASVVMSHKTAKDDSNMIFHVFDAMHFEDWRDQNNETEMQDRAVLVKELVDTIGSKAVLLVDGKTVNDQAELMKFYGETMERGYEGIMLKDLHAPYRFKRSDAVLKLKPVATAELVVTGHYEGNRGSKREGMWGGFVAVGANGIATRIGGGFNDAFRAEVAVNGPDSYIGRIIECEYQPDPLTADGLTEDGKLRFPVFCRFRDDRDVDPKLLAVRDNQVKAVN